MLAFQVSARSGLMHRSKAALLDHLVGTHQERLGDRDLERPRDSKVENKIKYLGGALLFVSSADLRTNRAVSSE